VVVALQETLRVMGEVDGVISNKYAERLAFVPLKGRLGFSDVDLDAVRAAQRSSEARQRSLDGMM
jgi:hypothetical protein